MSADANPHSVLSFWFGDGLELGWPSSDRAELWWGGGIGLDQRINTQFGSLVKEAMAGGLQEWTGEPASRLALVILLDQFTRNVYRGRAEAFAGDALAQKLVMQSLDVAHDQRLPLVGRSFFYMPLMHAENLQLQDECVKRFSRMLADAPEPLKKHLQGNVKFAIEHRGIIAQFGRFPHRNKVLGRANSPAEDEFLKNGPRYGQ